MRILFPSLRIPFVTISLARSRASMIAASFPLSLGTTLELARRPRVHLTPSSPFRAFSFLLTV